MGKTNVYVICAGILALCIQDSMPVPINELKNLTTEELRNIMATIPEAERTAFIRNNIELGYRIQYTPLEWPNQKDADLAVRIFNYFVDNEEAIRNKKMLINSAAILTDTICYPDPIGCIDPDDPGIRPTL